MEEAVNQHQGVSALREVSARTTRLYMVDARVYGESMLSSMVENVPEDVCASFEVINFAFYFTATYVASYLQIKATGALVITALINFKSVFDTSACALLVCNNCFVINTRCVQQVIDLSHCLKC